MKIFNTLIFSASLLFSFLLLTSKPAVSIRPIVSAYHVNTAGGQIRDEYFEGTPSKTSTPGGTLEPTKIPVASIIPTQKPTLSNSTYEQSVIAQSKYPALIAFIFKSESGSGTNDVCRNYGEYNGFGYDEYTGHHPTCFKTFEEVVGRVEKWIADKLTKGKTYAQMTCLYIRGIDGENCDTAYKFQNGIE